MSSLRFAVIGDTHYCTMKGRSPDFLPGDYEHLPDYFRYSCMTETLRALADRIRAEKPELLISTGDLIEGGADNTADEQEARELFSSCAPVFLHAPGTHDPKREQACGKFRRADCVFLLLDYTDWNEKQKQWLIRELKETGNAKHRFVFAHPPLHLFGRHFFYNPPFCPETEALLKQYPADIYFCGHTHNQGISFHSGMLQLTGSAVGYSRLKTIPLEEVHSIQDTAENRYLWGIAEDSAPGFWIVDAEDETLTIRWHSLNGSAELRVRKRFAFPEIVSLPPFVRECRPLTHADLCQIRSAWIHFFSANKGEKGFRMSLNAVELGAAPESSSYAARRALLLPETALRTIKSRNELKLTFPRSEVFAAGSISLEVLLLDGRTIRSSVAPELFICGTHPDFEYARRRCIAVRPGEERTLSLLFPSGDLQL